MWPDGHIICSIFGHLQQWKLVPIQFFLKYVGSKTFQIVNKASKIAKDFKNLPNCQNFAKSGHTVHWMILNMVVQRAHWVHWRNWGLKRFSSFSFSKCKTIFLNSFQSSTKAHDISSGIWIKHKGQWMWLSWGRAVAFNSRGPRFESSNRQFYVSTVNFIEETKINNKGPI